jgi:hypothetical protein
MRAVRSSALRFDFGEMRLGDARAPSASSKLFLQTFPNLGCFAPSFSKDFFAVLCDFKGLQAFQTQSVPRQIFCPSMGSKSRSRAAPSVGRVEGSSKYASMDRAFQKENSAQLISLRIAVQPPGSRGGPSTSMGVLAHSGATPRKFPPRFPRLDYRRAIAARVCLLFSRGSMGRGAGGRRLRGGRGRWLDA